MEPGSEDLMSQTLWLYAAIRVLDPVQFEEITRGVIDKPIKLNHKDSSMCYRYK